MELWQFLLTKENKQWSNWEKMNELVNYCIWMDPGRVWWTVKEDQDIFYWALIQFSYLSYDLCRGWELGISFSWKLEILKSYRQTAEHLICVGIHLLFDSKKANLITFKAIRIPDPHFIKSNSLSRLPAPDGTFSQIYKEHRLRN